MSGKIEILRKNPFKIGIQKISRRNLLTELGWEFKGEGLWRGIASDWLEKF